MVLQSMESQFHGIIEDLLARKPNYAIYVGKVVLSKQTVVQINSIVSPDFLVYIFLVAKHYERSLNRS